ncbi:MAG: response regulator [Actinobacteria bacterium]|nr:response regulator [Actinomycetota bacterium]
MADDAAATVQTKLLIVDDEEPVRRALERILERKGYDCTSVEGVDTAREALTNDTFALVLSDVNMPGESGIDLVKTIVADYPDTATVMCTGLDDSELARTAIEIGAYGYIVKPFEPNEIVIAVMNALRRRELEIENRQHREHLEDMVKARTSELWTAISDLERTQKELRLSREETIERLSVAAEFKDLETATHIRRMSLYCALLAERLGEDASRCEQIRLASQMHDVGKIGVPDQILSKPGPLTPDEWKIMKQHSAIGHRILSNSGSELLNLAAVIALTHHERMDGTGYPQGLVEDDIPFEGKVSAVADVFDALTTNRVYRRAFPLGEALEIMRQGKGDHFDPKILDCFFDSMDRVLGIKELHGDPHPSHV